MKFENNTEIRVYKAISEAKGALLQMKGQIVELFSWEGGGISIF
jgi:hypothetical protein